MKHESRVVVSLCRGPICASFIVRGAGIDGFVASTSCEGLLARLKETGYIYEARYYVGSCRGPGPEAPERLAERSRAYLRLLDQLLSESTALLETIKYLNLELLSGS